MFSVSQEHLVSRSKIFWHVSPAAITNGFCIRTVAFSFRSEWIPAVTTVKEEVSSHLLQNSGICSQNHYIPETDTEWDGSHFGAEEDPRGLREEMELADVREDKTENGRRRKELTHSAEAKKKTVKWDIETRKIQCMFRGNGCGHNPKMTVITAPFGHWKKATAMIECVVTIYFHSYAALPMSVFPHKLQYNTLTGAQLCRARTWGCVCLSLRCRTEPG